MEKTASNDNKLKRGYFHDYHSPCIYLITVTVVDRKPLLGQVMGETEHAFIRLTETGKMVERQIYAIPQSHPQVQVLQYQIMPDHVHLVLRVLERLPEQMPIGNVVAAWKQACGRVYSDLLWRDLKASSPDTQRNAESPLSREATFRSQEKTQSNTAEPQSKPPYKPLFSKGYNDSILYGKGQLNRMIAYVKDNPRRLLIKQQHHAFFTIHKQIAIAGMNFDAVGSLSLLQKPMLAVHCHCRWSEEETKSYAEDCLRLANQGAVLVGAFISKAEKAIETAASEKSFPIIRLVENGFNNLYKPVGLDFFACAEGRLLLLAPWPYHNDRHPITRQQCLELNKMAESIAASSHILNN